MQIVNEIGNVQLMQKINRLKVLDLIRTKGVAARTEVSKETGLSPSSITNIVSYLMEKKLIVEVGTVDSHEVGRKARLLKFNPNAFNIISVNIEISTVILALTNMNGDVIRKKEVTLDRKLKEFEILNIIKTEISQLIGEIQEKNPDINIAGIGIAVSGLVEDDKRVVISSSLRWRGLSLKESFEKRFQIPTFVQNNSRTKAIYELRRKRNELEKNIIFLDLAVGIGIISFFEHKINEAVIGEFGHTTVKKDGPICFCGNRGCLELMCSVDTVIERCSELIKKGNCKILKNLMDERNISLSYDLILEAYDRNDDDVAGVLKECGEYLGIGIANIINVFNPQRIIINGDILLKSDFIYNTAIEEAGKRAYEQFTKGLKYEKVSIDREKAIKGVSLYVTDKLLQLSGPEF